MAINFYKQGESYYTTDGRKVLNFQELQKLAREGGKEVSAPAINPSIQTTTPTNAQGELINPTQQDVASFDQQFTTTRVPDGMVAISGAQYNTREKQQNAFDNIQAIGNTLYGVPKQVVNNTGLSKTPLGLSGVNALFNQYYGRNAFQEELNYWSNKSDADLRPKLIPNSATELEKRKQNITTQTGEQTAEEKITEEYDIIINNDPFLTEQFKDANIKSQFSKMSPTLQMAYIQMMKSLGKTIEAGKVINPNIEITPEKIKEFTDQATKELDPYYQEQINNYKKDLETSISRLKEDFSRGVRNAEEPFKRNLAAAAESEAQAGLTYGSERGVREQTNIQGQQDLIDENALKVSRLAEDAYKQTERTLGSDVLSGISMPSLENYNVSKQGFAEAGLRNLYTPQGGLVGSLQKEKTTNIKSRTSELEDAYRRQRILNTSQL